MTSESPSAKRTTGGSTNGASGPAFTVQLGCTPRSARLARKITVRHLAVWGWARDSETSQIISVVVAELCANAVTHGRVPGRGFRLRVGVVTGAAHEEVFRIEVCDASPHSPSAPGKCPPMDADSGRGLLLVEALAERWGVTTHKTAGKTVWAELRALDKPEAEAAPATPVRGGTARVRPSAEGPHPRQCR